MTPRLALGTVQFGQRYGVANVSGQVEHEEVAAILRRARAAGIDTLDTAIAYGDSESCLGRADVTSWCVMTKLPPVPGAVGDIRNWIDLQVAGSMQRLGIEQLDVLMLHKSSDVMGSEGSSLRRALEAVKSSGRTRALGVSIYDPSELDALWPDWHPDVVQAPCNALDRRLVTSGWLGRLRRAGVRVHARSVFLQGLLLMPARRRPAYFALWADVLDRWLAWCDEQACSPLAAALGAVLCLPELERVIVGVDSLAHLDEIISAFSRPALAPPPQLANESRELIDPSRWKVV